MDAENKKAIQVYGFFIVNIFIYELMYKLLMKNAIDKVRQEIMAYENYIGHENNYSHLIDNALNEIIDENNKNEVVASDISLTSFKPQKHLNPKFWINNSLNSRIRLKLLDIADDFVDTLEVDWAKPIDIILTGSLTNYNWSKYSDVDLHIIFNYKQIDPKINLVKDYLDAKRKLWNNKHDNLKIYGFPIEIYLQDINEKHESSGIYSLEKNEWLVKPNDNVIKPIGLNKFFIKEKTAKLMTDIDNIISMYDKNLNEYDIKVIGLKAKKLFNKIKYIRKYGLINYGEMSSENIIFKILRRSGYIDKLSNLITKTYDLANSIK